MLSVLPYWARWSPPRLCSSSFAAPRLRSHCRSGVLASVAVSIVVLNDGRLGPVHVVVQHTHDNQAKSGKGGSHSHRSSLALSQDAAYYAPCHYKSTRWTPTAPLGSVFRASPCDGAASRSERAAQEALEQSRGHVVDHPAQLVRKGRESQPRDREDSGPWQEHRSLFDLGGKTRGTDTFCIPSD